MLCMLLFCRLQIIFKIIFSKNFFQKYHQNINQFGSRSCLTFCWVWSQYKLFAKVDIRRQKSPPEGEVFCVSIQLNKDLGQTLLACDIMNFQLFACWEMFHDFLVVCSFFKISIFKKNLSETLSKSNSLHIIKHFLPDNAVHVLLTLSPSVVCW